MRLLTDAGAGVGRSPHRVEPLLDRRRLRRAPARQWRGRSVTATPQRRCQREPPPGLRVCSFPHHTGGPGRLPRESPTLGAWAPPAGVVPVAPRPCRPMVVVDLVAVRPPAVFVLVAWRPPVVPAVVALVVVCSVAVVLVIPVRPAAVVVLIAVCPAAVALVIAGRPAAVVLIVAGRPSTVVLVIVTGRPPMVVFIRARRRRQGPSPAVRAAARRRWAPRLVPVIGVDVVVLVLPRRPRER